MFWVVVFWYLTLVILALVVTLVCPTSQFETPTNKTFRLYDFKKLNWLSLVCRCAYSAFVHVHLNHWFANAKSASLLLVTHGLSNIRDVPNDLNGLSLSFILTTLPSVILLTIGLEFVFNFVRYVRAFYVDKHQPTIDNYSSKTTTVSASQKPHVSSVFELRRQMLRRSSVFYPPMYNEWYRYLNEKYVGSCGSSGIVSFASGYVQLCTVDSLLFTDPIVLPQPGMPHQFFNFLRLCLLIIVVFIEMDGVVWDIRKRMTLDNIGHYMHLVGCAFGVLLASFFCTAPVVSFVLWFVSLSVVYVTTPKRI